MVDQQSKEFYDQLRSCIKQLPPDEMMKKLNGDTSDQVRRSETESEESSIRNTELLLDDPVTLPTDVVIKLSFEDPVILLDDPVTLPTDEGIKPPEPVRSASDQSQDTRLPMSSAGPTEMAGQGTTLPVNESQVKAEPYSETPNDNPSLEFETGEAHTNSAQHSEGTNPVVGSSLCTRLGLLLGIVSIFMFWTGIIPISAIIVSTIGFIRMDKSTPKGRTQALLGLGLGIFYFGWFVVWKYKASGLLLQ